MRERWRTTAAVVVLFVVAFSPGALYAGAAGHSPRVSAPPGTPAGTLVRNPARAGFGSPISEASSAPSASVRPRGAARAPSALDRVTERSPELFPPNPDRPLAAPALAAGTSPYATAPAPMGLSDLGVGPNGSYRYGTQSFEGNLTLTSFAAFTATNATSTSEPAPDWVLLQLDAVAVNVTLPPGLTNGTFWIQNGVHLNGTSLAFEDNLWNFSSPRLVINTSTLLSGKGELLPSGAYVDVGPAFPIAFPLTIDLFDNISTINDHTVISVGFSVADPLRSHAATYDNVTLAGQASASSPSQFEVNGAAVTPAGLLYDTELDLGGNGEGANADVVSLNGTARLEFYHSGTGYEAVPSAFDFGVDASETAVGIAVAYTAGKSPEARLTAGPSFLNGLWNTTGTNATRIAPSASPGWIEVRLTVEPSFAIAFATTGATLSAAGGSLAAADYQYAPTDPGGNLTTDLPTPAAGDPYVFSAWADGFSSGTLNLSDNSTASSPDTLRLLGSPSVVDAPVYLLSTPQAEAFGLAHVQGTGYSGPGGTLWLNVSEDDLAAPFLRVNELGYPAFPLVAALRVNLSIVVNGFVQAPSSYGYTNETGKTIELANDTQGYFFYYGSGRFTVENTTVQGNASLAHGPPRTFPPSTVEFYRTTGAIARNLTVADDAVGVTIIDSASTEVTNLSVESGSLGILAEHASTVNVVRASASGHDPFGVSSTLAAFLGCSLVSLDNLSVAGFSAAPSAGVLSQNGTGLTVSLLTVSAGALGLDVNATDSGQVSALTVEGGFALAGAWTNGSDLTFQSLSIDGGGLDLADDQGVSLTDGSAVGFGSTVVGGFQASSGGTFRSINATGGADGLILFNCSTVTVTDVNASNGSVGTFLSNVTSVSGTVFSSTGYSVGLLLNNTTGGTFSSFVTSNESIGAFVENSSSISLGRVAASNLTLSSLNFFTNATQTQLFPVSAVGLFNDQRVNVSNISAVNYPFAVTSNNSTHVNVSSVVDLYGNTSVVFNWTNASRITQVFAFGDAEGISVQNTTGITVATSTLELSAGVGLEAAYTNHTSVENNNFIANDGASVNGHYSTAHLQAWANATNGTPAFKNNYWSDRSGSVAYVLNSSGPYVEDASPLSKFSSTYLEFTESGLPSGENWTVLTLGEAYTSNVSVLYVPGWAIATGTLPFTVEPVIVPTGPATSRVYPPTPADGTLVWTNTTSLTEAISFPSSGSKAPLSYWAVAAIVVAAGAAIAAAVLFLRRRRPHRPPAQPLNAKPGGVQPPGSQPQKTPPPGTRSRRPRDFDPLAEDPPR